MARRGQRSVLYAMLFSNWRNKSTALLLALVIWGIAFGSGLTTKTLEVDVDVTTGEQSEVVTDMFVLEQTKGKSAEGRVPFSGKVKLTVSGQRHVIDNLNSRYRGAFSPQRNGEVELLDTKSYDLPAGVEVVGAEPYRVRVAVERYIQVSLPVFVPIDGEAPEGLDYNATRVTTDPESVEVRIPESYRGQVELYTDPLDLSALRPSTSSFVELGLGNPVVKDSKLKSHLIRVDSAGFMVRVYPNLEDARKQESFKIPVLWAIESARTVTVSEVAKEVTVVIRATPDRLAEMRERVEQQQCKLFITPGLVGGLQGVNLSGFGRDSKNFDKAGWPDDVEVLEWIPALLNYEIEIK